MTRSHRAASKPGRVADRYHSEAPTQFTECCFISMVDSVMRCACRYRPSSQAAVRGLSASPMAAATERAQSQAANTMATWRLGMQLRWGSMTWMTAQRRLGARAGRRVVVWMRR